MYFYLSEDIGKDKGKFLQPLFYNSCKHIGRKVKTLCKSEFKKLIDYELFGGKQVGLIARIRRTYFQPNTNCMYLARKMWYHNDLAKKGGLFSVLHFLRAKFLYLHILKHYNCCFFMNANIGRGFYIEHPIGIVIGRCEIGQNFHIYQNSTIGVRRPLDDSKGLFPHIGDNVTIGCNCAVLGNVTIADNVIVGANSVVLNDLSESGTYVGAPARKVK